MQPKRLSVGSAERVGLGVHVGGATIIPSAFHRLERLSLSSVLYKEMNKCTKQVTSSGNVDFDYWGLPD